ncbi:hypothetical protein GF406_15590 [candidate division KSB1 bacterium]|nr:hypothetical protein [candidate division KSB1 bacterium]
MPDLVPSLWLGTQRIGSADSHIHDRIMFIFDCPLLSLSSWEDLCWSQPVQAKG